jgi:2-amino-4-hydroxy-6-hydroxymethyldihydropteridine diphosphokinase
MLTEPRHSVLIALGSNVGDRLLNLRRAVDALGGILRVVRVSGVWESAPVDAPRGSGAFLNMVVAGWAAAPPRELLGRMHRIEEEMGRVRRRKNEPRVIDLDLILHGASLARDASLVLPHPRYRERGFVLDPLRELRLPWVDPSTTVPLARIRADGGGVRVGRLYEGPARSVGATESRRRRRTRPSGPRAL